MTSLRTLSIASGVPAEVIRHWHDLIALGSGFSRVTIPQKRRRRRTVYMPSVGLDRVLKQLALGISLVSDYNAPAEVHGFVRGRDIRTNATEHLGADVVLRVDLKDFFGTVDGPRLSSALRRFEFEEDCIDAIAGVALVNEALPQGFSTSPILSNLAFHATDEALSGHVHGSGVRYTRYVDDLTFSGPRDAVHDELLDAIEALLGDQGWTVNRSKTRFMRRGRPQYVTGLYVGDPSGPHIPRKMKRMLRREVHFAARFGVEDSRLRSPTPIDADRLGGWVHYVAHVEPVVGSQLRATWRLAASSRPNRRPNPDWDKILDDIGFPDDW